MRKRGTLGVASLILLALGAPRSVNAQEDPTQGQKLATRTKPSVVRVVAGYQVDIPVAAGKTENRFIGGHGTGFFIDPTGYVATNAHVVELVHDGEDKAKEQIAGDVLEQLGIKLDTLPAGERDRFMRLALAEIRITKKVTIIILPNGDRLSYDVKAYGTPVGAKGVKDVAILKVQTKNAPTLNVGDETTVQIQDKIYAIGYPGAADDLAAVLDEDALLDATITDGAVSAKKKSSDGVPVIQVTTIISPGNSGGPAINEKGDVVGLATFGHAKRQGYNFLVPASTLKEFIKQAGAENKPSLTNEAFDEGLELHWDHQYTAAIEKFEEVKQLFPSHSEVDALITEASELKREGKEKVVKKEEGGSSGGAVIGIVVTLLIVGGFAAFVVVQRKKRAHPHPGQWQGHLAHAPPTMQPPGYAPGHAQNAPTPYGHAPPPANLHAAYQQAVHHGQPQAAQSAHQLGHAATSLAGPDPQPPSGGFMKTMAVSAKAGADSLAGLACVRGLLHGQHFQLGAHGIIIGREAGVAQVVINDGRVSSKHVWIGFQDGKLLAIDQGSTNGTFVNDMNRGRITKAELRHGDTVIVSEPDVCSLTVLFQS